MIASGHQSRRPRQRQPGYTVMEVVVSLGAATLLMAGLSSSLLIATKAFDGNAPALTRSKAAEVQAQMLADISEATSFGSRTSSEIRFSVPDRNGDQVEESITYSWHAGNKELSYQYNGSGSEVLLTDVSDLQFKYLSRAMGSGLVGPKPYDSNEWGNRWIEPPPNVVAYHCYGEGKTPSNEKFVDIGLPIGTTDGDLLIAAVATDGNTEFQLNAPSGWTLVARESYSSYVTLGVWMKNASSEPSTYRFSWSDNQQAYGWIMRFSGHNASAPINGGTIQTTPGGYTFYPSSPAVTTNVENALILRLGAFDDDNINIDSPGLSGHTAITMDESNYGSGTCAGGAGFVTQESAGNSGASFFTLTDNEQAVAITIAIAPAE